MEQTTIDSPSSKSVSINLLYPSESLQKPSRKRLILLLIIFCLLLISSISGFIYLEKHNRIKIKDQFQTSLQQKQMVFPKATSFTPINTPIASPITLPSPVYASPGKQFLVENDRYRLFIIAKGGTFDLEGTLTIFDKQTNSEINISDDFNIFGGPSIITDKNNQYLGINTGTYITRGIQLISLVNKRKVASFCSLMANLRFWKEYVIYTSCELLPESLRDVTPGIVALNLANQQTTKLYTATEINEFRIKELEEDILTVEESFATNPKDWISANYNELIKTRTHTYDLNKLIQ